MEKSKKQATCLACEREIYARGLCSACYQAAMASIAREEYTDDQLVSAGLILPSRKQKNPWLAKAEQVFA